METYLFRYGETVRMIDDMVKVHQKQQIGAGWNDDMALVSVGVKIQVHYPSIKTHIRHILLKF